MHAQDSTASDRRHRATGPRSHLVSFPTVVRLTTLTLALAATLLVCDRAQASPMGRPFGLGVTFGAPTGLTLKNYFDSHNALQAALGLGWLGGSGLHIHVDYLYHIPVARTPHVEVPFYLGVGGKVAVWFAGDGGHYWGSDDGRAAFGVRVPFGISFDFRRAPFDIFAEIVPGLGAWANGVGFFVDAALGFRFYF